MSRASFAAAFLALCAAGSPHALASSCSSDGQPQPVALLERFISADCADCWTSAATPKPGRGELALDWIVPGRRGDDAPLSAAASRDAPERLRSLGRAAPEAADSLRSARRAGAGTLRVAHGPTFNGYIAGSIQSLGGGPGPFTGWMALVETLPAGTEGSPVERNLVRNLLQVPWPAAPGRRFEARPLSIPEGANPDRLRIVGWLQDARGVIRAISETRCEPGEGTR